MILQLLKQGTLNGSSLLDQKHQWVNNFGKVFETQMSASLNISWHNNFDCYSSKIVKTNSDQHGCNHLTIQKLYSKTQTNTQLQS